MRPTGVEPATFGLKDRRSLGPRKDPLTTELRALTGDFTRAGWPEHCRDGGWGEAGGSRG
jgi:nicotinamidase-related amidase